ncbi:MAG: flavodoxin family protein [Nitrospirae bacterium]|nr:flavodoxin family protein [Nitrospirota bacterium]
MKVIAFNGSARKGGNTEALIKIVFEELQKEGIETELISLAGKNLSGCIACYKCWKNKDQRCHGVDDEINEYIEKMLDAEGIILGSPTYFADVTANMKAFIERVGMVARANEDMLKRKVGASVVAVRRGGATHVFNSLNFFFLIAQMVVPGSSYWNLGRGRQPGEVLNDEEGIKTMRDLGQNMAWLIKKLYTSSDVLEP